MLVTYGVPSFRKRPIVSALPAGPLWKSAAALGTPVDRQAGRARARMSLESGLRLALILSLSKDERLAQDRRSICLDITGGGNGRRRNAPLSRWTLLAADLAARPRDAQRAHRHDRADAGEVPFARERPVGRRARHAV